MLFFRVVVMLSCLILVPLAAIFGSAFPDLVKTQLVERCKTLAGLDSPTEPLPPRAASDGTRFSRATTADAPRWNTADAAPAWQPAVSPLPDATQQVDYTTPASPPASGPAVQPRQEFDHFTEIQHRLRDLGARHYSLESIESQGNYRFHCKMNVPGSENTEDFEAIDRDPLQAMAHVLSQVEAWRGLLSAKQTEVRSYQR